MFCFLFTFWFCFLSFHLSSHLSFYTLFKCNFFYGLMPVGHCAIEKKEKKKKQRISPVLFEMKDSPEYVAVSLKMNTGDQEQSYRSGNIFPALQDVAYYIDTQVLENFVFGNSVNAVVHA